MSNFLTGTSNAAYHADRTHLSSSGLKLLLESPAQFYREYILGEKPVRDTAAFAEGSLVHTLILEPHLLTEQYLVYPGPQRRGKAYEAWLSEQGDVTGKTIVTAAQSKRANELAAIALSNPEVINLLAGTKPEFSMIGEIQGVKVKCRADAIRTNGVLIDVKTTSRPITDAFEETVERYCYDLSAALYCYIAGQNFNKPFEFYWIVLSKADKGVSVIKATARDIHIGKQKVRRAIEIYKHCKETGVWEMPSDVKPREVKMSNTFKTKKGTELPLMNLKGKPYLQVAHRFVMLNDETNRFVIKTEFPVLTDEQTVCTAQVLIMNTEEGRQGEVLRQASGTKRETKKDFADHTEKAETGAIGRALAMLGFGTQFAIEDIGDEGDRLADAPVNPAKRPVSIKKASNSNSEF